MSIKNEVGTGSSCGNSEKGKSREKGVMETMLRYKASKDYTNDCLTICDSEEKLKTSFDSDICLSPMDDALIVVNELNRSECVIESLKQTLRDNYFSEDDIRYIVDAANDDFEEELE